MGSISLVLPQVKIIGFVGSQACPLGINKPRNSHLRALKVTHLPPFVRLEGTSGLFLTL